MKTSDIEVNTRKYLASHGKEPKGYSAWAFEILHSICFYTASYSNAVQCARQEMKKRCVQFGISIPPAIVLLT